MLQKLTIKNIALIDSVQIDFSTGLNVLSGETGAGKSVIIESLNFVLGAKADKSLIRSGQNECSVTAEFIVSDNQTISAIFEELGFDNEELLIIFRKFSVDGKSSIKINGNTVTAGMLKKFTSALVDVHGQSEHFALLSATNQLKLIDKFGGNTLNEEKIALKEVYSEYKQVVKELEELGGDENQRLIRLDVLNYQINEIISCDLREGEEENLLEIRKKLINQEKIATALCSVKSALSDEGGVSDILSNAVRALGVISEFSQEYNELTERINDAYSELDDISSTAANLIDELDVGEYDADYVETRLDTIKKLKKKYGNSHEEICEFLANAQEEKEKLENFNENATKLLEHKIKLEKDIYARYAVLSNLRRNCAQNFADNVIAELKELGMTKSNFKVQFNDMPNQQSCNFASANGFDDIEFLFSANLGEPLKPLSSVISGGEMSRFMLAIKAQTAKYNELSTFIFDEIDAGISGVVARTVAQKFVRIAKDVQVIAITHLPQISAMADNNLLIIKTEDETKTTTKVKTLSYEEKVMEIVRLSGGTTDSTDSVAHANSLIEYANNYKQNI